MMNPNISSDLSRIIHRYLQIVQGISKKTPCVFRDCFRPPFAPEKRPYFSPIKQQKKRRHANEKDAPRKKYSDPSNENSFSFCKHFKYTTNNDPNISNEFDPKFIPEPQRCNSARGPVRQVGGGNMCDLTELPLELLWHMYIHILCHANVTGQSCLSAAIGSRLCIPLNS